MEISVKLSKKHIRSIRRKGRKMFGKDLVVLLRSFSVISH